MSKQVIEIIDNLSKGKYFTLNGKPVSLSEVSDIMNAQQKEIERLREELAKERYLVDKYTRQLTDEYKNTEYQCKEKERLNNIINELEKWAKGYIFADIFKDKIKELKGDDSNE